MAIWQPGDAERIRSLLRLPPPIYAPDPIIVGMNFLTVNYPDAIQTVRDNLTRLETIRDALTALYTDSNYTLIKADVLEWSENNSKAEGLENLKAELQDDIAIALRIKGAKIYNYYNSGINSGGSSPMYRS